jgi:Holliday junction resolvase
MDGVIVTEVGLFDYIKNRYLEDLEMSSDAFEYIDATSQGYRLIIELKCRHTHYDELILEKDKHESLVQQADKLGFTPFYINSTPQGIYAFNLRKIKVTWTTRKLPASTFNKTIPVDKTVAYLHIDEAVKL